MPIFVPGSKVYVPDGLTREEELRQSKVFVPEGAEVEEVVDEKGSEKAQIEHMA